MSNIKKVPSSLANSRLDKASAEIFNQFSRTQIKKWILNGRILLNNEIAVPKDTVYTDDEIEINPISERKVVWHAQDINFEVIHEEKDFLIINKQPDLVVHPGAGRADGTLANGLLHAYPELSEIPRCGIVHRLDKGTSGILLIAKNDKFRNYFVKLLQERNVKKNYKAIVIGNAIGSFSIEDPIGRDRKKRTKMAIRVDGKSAYTFVKPVQNFGGYSLLDISIETGRTHQIRVHLSSIKMPIIGDKTYNQSVQIAKNTSLELQKEIRNFPRQALHSSEISFFNPNIDKEVTFSSPMYKDMELLLNKLKKQYK